MNLNDCRELRILYVAGADVDKKDKDDLDKAIPSLAIFGDE